MPNIKGWHGILIGLLIGAALYHVYRSKQSR